MTTVERSFDPQAVNEIQVNLAAGDVQIGRGEGGQIEIQASFSSGNEHGFQADLAGGILYVGRPRHPEDSGEFAARSGQSGRANVTLTLPAGANPELSVHTGKGDVSASGVGKLSHVHSGKGDVHVSQGHGQTAIHTGLGDVAISHWQGDASVQTGKGAVHLDGLIGGLSVHSGAGDVAVRDWQAPSPEEPPAESGEIETGKGDVFVETARVPRLRIHTGRGDCHLQQVDAAKLEMQAGAGDMLLQGDPGTGRWRARTGSGDILLHLPASANVRVEAATRRGDIKFDLPQVRVGRPGPVSQRGGRTIGVLGEDPRAEIELETGHGDIGAHLYGAPPAVAGELPGLAADVPLPAPDRPRAETPEVPAEPTVPTPPSTPPPPPAKTESNTTALRILESLAQGEISVQEAESLLRSLEPA